MMKITATAATPYSAVELPEVVVVVVVVVMFPDPDRVIVVAVPVMVVVTTCPLAKVVVVVTVCPGRVVVVTEVVVVVLVLVIVAVLVLVDGGATFCKAKDTMSPAVVPGAGRHGLEAASPDRYEEVLLAVDRRSDRHTLIHRRADVVVSEE